MPVPSGVLPYVRFLLSSLRCLSSWSFSSKTFCLASSALLRCSGCAEGRSRSWLSSALNPLLTSAMLDETKQVRGYRFLGREMGEGFCWLILQRRQRHELAATLCKHCAVVCCMNCRDGVEALVGAKQQASRLRSFLDSR
jgi:hypothetical protein